MLLFSSFIIVLGATLLLAWPKSNKGCLAGLARFVAVVIGALAPLIILWQAPTVVQALGTWRGATTILAYVSVIGSIILGSCVIILGATGWQILWQRRGKDIEDKIDLSFFDPFSLASSPSHSSSADDSLGGCLLSIVLGVIGAFFLLGLLLSTAIKQYGLPQAKTKTTRLSRAILCFSYALVLYLGLMGLLFLLIEWMPQ